MTKKYQLICAFAFIAFCVCLGAIGIMVMFMGVQLIAFALGMLAGSAYFYFIYCRVGGTDEGIDKG